MGRPPQWIYEHGAEYMAPNGVLKILDFDSFWVVSDSRPNHIHNAISPTPLSEMVEHECSPVTASAAVLQRCESGGKEEVEMDWMWTWSGRCFGYRDGDDLWTYDGHHFGRFQGNEIYGPTGFYLGELSDGRLISSKHSKGKAIDPYDRQPSRNGLTRPFERSGWPIRRSCEDFPEEISLSY